MDFGKVKLLLIVVFIGLNIFLAYQWSVLGSSVSTYAEPISDQVADIKRNFALHHVTLSAQLPLSPSMLAPMMATRANVWFPVAAQIAIAASKKSLSVSSAKVSDRIGTAVMSAPGTLHVEYRPPLSTVVIKSDDRMNQLDKFLQRHVYNFNQYQLLSITLIRQSGRVTFVETSGNNPVYCAPLEVMIRRGSVAGYSQTYLNLQKPLQLHSVIDAANALMAVSSYMDKAQIQIDNTVKGMQIGYTSNELTGEWVYLTPVWRIGSVRGYFYVNALNGEVSVQNQ